MIEYNSSGYPYIRNSKLLIYNLRVPPEVYIKTRCMDFKDKQALNCVIVNMLACLRKDNTLVYSRHKASSTKGRSNKKAMTTKRVILAVDFITEMGWCVNYVGTQHPDPKKRYPSIILPTQEFVDFWGVDVGTLKEIEMNHVESSEVIELRGEGKMTKPFNKTSKVASMEDVVKRLNTAIALCEVQDSNNAPLTNVYCRIFNNDFEHGGRYYKADILNIENTVTKSRLDVKIDGQMVVEVDYRNLHFRIAAAMEGCNDTHLPFDVYSSLLEDKNNTVERKIVKLAVNVMFNARSNESARRAIQDKINSLTPEQKAQYTLGSAKAVMHLIKEVYYDFRHLFCNEDSFGLRLQNHDSELATDVITTLLDNGVVCLPVHDSFIVKMQDRKLLEDTMAECFRERFGTTNLVPLGVSYKVDGLVEEAIILA